MKYKLLDVYKDIDYYDKLGGIRLKPVRLYQIQRLSDGQLGGFIESEKNLSQEGDCWVGPGSMVYGDACVFDNAKIFGKSTIKDNAKIFGDSTCNDCLIENNVLVYGNAHIRRAFINDDVRICDRAEINTVAKVSGNAFIYGDAYIEGPNLYIYGYAKIYDKARVEALGTCSIFENAKIYENATFNGEFIVRGNAEVHGEAFIGGGQIRDNAKVYKDSRIYNSPMIKDDAKIVGAQVSDYALIEDRAIIKSKSHVSGRAQVSGRAIICKGSNVKGDSIIGEDSFIRNSNIYNSQILGESSIMSATLEGCNAKNSFVQASYAIRKPKFEDCLLRDCTQEFGSDYEDTEPFQAKAFLGDEILEEGDLALTEFLADEAMQEFAKLKEDIGRWEDHVKKVHPTLKTNEKGL